LERDSEENLYIVEAAIQCKLSELLKEEILSKEQRLTIAIDIAKTLVYLHNNRIVHRNINADTIRVQQPSMNYYRAGYNSNSST
jgi:serine/threonine protein kinase